MCSQKRKRMRNLCLLLSTTAVVVMFFSCSREKTVTISPSATTRAVGCIFALDKTVSPEGATKNVIWTSSDPEIATVENGIVTALYPGETTITATIKGSNRKDVSVVTVAIGCNNNTPGWGGSLGVVSFKTDQTWKVAEQEWSDVVMATACRKTSFSGGPWGNQDADCRSNFGHGDLFSWCAVIRFQDQLCPAPWRVPTAQDFANLDLLLGGPGTGESYANSGLRDKYISNWGGELYIIGHISFYWALTEHNPSGAVTLSFNSDAIANSPPYQHVFPRSPSSKAGNPFSGGNVLRCVRDN